MPLTRFPSLRLILAVVVYGAFHVHNLDLSLRVMGPRAVSEICQLTLGEALGSCE